MVGINGLFFGKPEKKLSFGKPDIDVRIILTF
jgi:hypothetical protein